MVNGSGVQLLINVKCQECVSSDHVPMLCAHGSTHAHDVTHMHAWVCTYRYRSLGIATVDNYKSLEAKKATQMTAHDLKWQGKRDVKTLVWSNFTKELGKVIRRLCRRMSFLATTPACAAHTQVQDATT